MVPLQVHTRQCETLPVRTQREGNGRNLSHWRAGGMQVWQGMQEHMQWTAPLQVVISSTDMRQDPQCTTRFATPTSEPLRNAAPPGIHVWRQGMHASPFQARGCSAGYGEPPCAAPHIAPVCWQHACASRGGHKLGGSPQGVVPVLTVLHHHEVPNILHIQIILSPLLTLQL